MPGLVCQCILVVQRLVICVRTGLSVYVGSTVTVVCVRTGLSVYAGSSDWWFVSGLVCQCILVVQRLVVCVRTGLPVYTCSTVIGG